MLLRREAHKLIEDLIAMTFAATEERRRETTGWRERMRTCKIPIQIENTLEIEDQ